MSKREHMHQERGMVDCWWLHPIDDEDCLSCPSVKDCREIRQRIINTDEITEEAYDKELEVMRLKNDKN